MVAFVQPQAAAIPPIPPVAGRALSWLLLPHLPAVVSSLATRRRASSRVSPVRCLPCHSASPFARLPPSTVPASVYQPCSRKPLTKLYTFRQAQAAYSFLCCR